MTAQIADVQLEPGDDSVPGAISVDTVPRPTDVDATTTLSSGTMPKIPLSTLSGADGGNSGSGFMPPIFKNSGEPSSGLTRRWRQPRNVREFAAQANAVATMVLNGNIELEAARAYSSVARTVAQAMSTEVSRSRFIRSEPSLDLSGDVFEESLCLTPGELAEAGIE